MAISRVWPRDPVVRIGGAYATPKSVLFVDANSAMAQDANFTWDNVAGILDLLPGASATSAQGIKLHDSAAMMLGEIPSRIYHDGSGSLVIDPGAGQTLDIAQNATLQPSAAGDGSFVLKANTAGHQASFRLYGGSASVYSQWLVTDTNAYLSATGGDLYVNRAGGGSVVFQTSATERLRVYDTYVKVKNGYFAVEGPSLTGSSATGAATVSQTWNTTGSPTALTVSVTNTGSPGASSYLADLRYNAASLFSVRKDGAVIIATSKTPSSSSDTGTTGEIAWDANYIYVCVGTNAWGRAALTLSF